MAYLVCFSMSCYLVLVVFIPMHVIRRIALCIQKEKCYLKYSGLQKLRVTFFSLVLLVEVRTLPPTFHLRKVIGLVEIMAAGRKSLLSELWLLACSWETKQELKGSVLEKSFREIFNKLSSQNVLLKPERGMRDHSNVHFDSLREKRPNTDQKKIHIWTLDAVDCYQNACIDDDLKIAHMLGKMLWKFWNLINSLSETFVILLHFSAV